MTEKTGGRVKKTYLQVKQMPDSTSEPEAMEAFNNVRRRSINRRRLTIRIIRRFYGIASDMKSELQRILNPGGLDHVISEQSRFFTHHMIHSRAYNTYHNHQ